MKRLRLFFLLLAMAAFAGVPAGAVRIRQIGTTGEKVTAPGSGKEPLLRWRNGETLPGELISATGEALTWRSPLFEDPLVIGWPSIRRVEQRLADQPSGEAFGFVLRDGSYLAGQLTGITPDTVSLKSARHGEVTLRRSEVLSVRRRQSKTLTWAGPAGEVGWRTYVIGQGSQAGDDETTTPTVPALREGPGGRLEFPFWNRAAVLDLKLPEQVNLEFRVSSRTRPDFALYLEGNGPSGPRVEMWDGELVLVGGARFCRLRTVPEGELSVALRLLCDRKAHTCSAWTPEGELLADWKYTPEALSGTAGIVLQSKGRDLTLESLSVRPWNGKTPAKVNPAAARVELADGRTLEGTVTAAAADWVTVRGKEGEAEESFALADVETMIFSADAPKPVAQPATLLYTDGTLLQGRLAKVEEGVAEVGTTFAEKPVSAGMKGLRRLAVEPPAEVKAPAEAPLAELDAIELGELTLHGKLSGAGEGTPRWLPVGGLRPVRPAPGGAGVISRSLAAAGAMPGTSALFYTGLGDVLPGRLRGLDSTGVEIESAMVAITHLPGEMLQAIQFGSVAQSGIKGFEDPGWRLLKGDAKQMKLEKGVLHLEPGTSYGHPSAMQGTEVKFAIGAEEFGTLRLRMFCAGTDPAKSVNLAFQHYSQQMTFGLESEEGQLESQFQVHSATSPLPVRLLISDTAVEVFVDGNSIRKFPIEASRRAGSGLIVEPSSLWGNRVSALSLSAFSAPPSPGRTWLPDVNPQARMEALTVPRFRKETPPRQALIAANGDVLRGEILAATATHFEFRSGLENLRVPQDRVRAAVWLKKPVPGAVIPPPSVEDPIRKRLGQTLEQHFGMSNAVLTTALSVLQQQAGDLKFKIPEGTDRRRFHIQFGGETIGEALDKLCELTGYHYRIDETGTIVFEAAVKSSAKYTQRVYWLKPDAFPADGAAQQILLAKGLTFPAGAAAEWRAASHQLVMANTSENHEKLLSLLESEFGGSLGSPTHWLLLTNGARLALAVDKFGPEAIVGHHPLYGQCTVLLKDVYRIHTAEPPPTSVMTSLGDWRLVNAPEPVIPESGGESSPLVGKEAKAFKLKLLDGGEFELAKEKGKVVVLDFWATWCGPCVKSLPGLIEAMAPFDAGKVKFVGLNQGEAPEQVKSFLEARDWKLTVALDSAQSVAQQYGVDGIPFTVVIGQDGKVAYLKTGYTPDGDAEIAGVVKKLLDPAAKPDPAPTAPSEASPAPSADSRAVPRATRG